MFRFKIHHDTIVFLTTRDKIFGKKIIRKKKKLKQERKHEQETERPGRNKAGGGREIYVSD